MPGSFFQDALDEVRIGMGQRLKWIIIVFACFLIGGAVIVGVTYFVSGQAKPRTPDVSDLPLGQEVTSVLDVANCIYEGEKACPQYKQSTEWLGQNTASGITYQPMPEAKASPGKNLGDGTKHVTDLASLDAGQWKALAAALTSNGTVTSSTVEENAVRTTNLDMTALTATGRFPVESKAPKAPTSGVMTFSVGGRGLSLTGIQYTEGQ